MAEQKSVFRTPWQTGTDRGGFPGSELTQGEWASGRWAEEL